MVMTVRMEEPADQSAIFHLHLDAFETAAEANLVNRLRSQAANCLSLVAVTPDRLLGHLLLSPVTLEGHAELSLMGLAPMAVTPGQQRRGIGGALINAGLDACRVRRIAAVVVLGHPAYYPKFGFVPAVGFGIDCDYQVPSDAFMLQELQPGALAGRQGRIHYHPAFAALE